MFGIPKENLPDTLNDEERINVLYAPFRSQQANSKDWDSKLSSWKNIISLYCSFNNIYTFSVSSLKHAFKSNERSPTCLDTVVGEMLKSGEIQNVNDFWKTQPQSWSGWATNVLVKKPMSWSFHKMKSLVVSEDISKQNFIPVEVVREKSNKLITSVPSELKNHLISIHELKEAIQNNIEAISIDNLKILIHHLYQQRKIDVTYLNSKVDNSVEILVKIGNGATVAPITEVEIGIYNLEQNEKMLAKTVTNMEDESEKCTEDAKNHIRKNHRQMAKTCLRKKHEIEKRIERKSNALYNVQVLIEQMKDTKSDAEVWKAYKNALGAFNSNVKETQISEDAVEDTMLKIGDMMDIHSEIESALSHPVLDSNDSELEEELAELMKQDSEETKTNNNEKELENKLENLDLNLPDVPNVSPNTSVENPTLSQI